MKKFVCSPEVGPKHITKVKPKPGLTNLSRWFQFIYSKILCSLIRAKKHTDWCLLLFKPVVSNRGDFVAYQIQGAVSRWAIPAG